MIVLQSFSDACVTGIAGAGFVQRALGDSPFYNREVNSVIHAVDREALVVVYDREAVVFACECEAVNAPSGSRI